MFPPVCPRSSDIYWCYLCGDNKAVFEEWAKTGILGKFIRVMVCEDCHSQIVHDWRTNAGGVIITRTPDQIYEFVVVL